MSFSSVFLSLRLLVRRRGRGTRGAHTVPRLGLSRWSECRALRLAKQLRCMHSQRFFFVGDYTRWWSYSILTRCKNSIWLLALRGVGPETFTYNSGACRLTVEWSQKTDTTSIESIGSKRGFIVWEYFEAWSFLEVGWVRRLRLRTL